MSFKTALTVIAASALMSPQTAGAETRHAAPEGRSAGVCAAADPCSLRRAVIGAADGDLVQLAGGRYDVAAPIRTERRVVIEAAEADRRPHVHGGLDDGGAVLDLGEQSVVRDLDLTVTGQGIAIRRAALVERSRLTLVPGAGSLQGIVHVGGSMVVRDTVIHGDGGSLTGIQAIGSTAAADLALRNVTIVLGGRDAIAVIGVSASDRQARLRARATLLRARLETMLVGVAGAPAEMMVADSNLRGGDAMDRVGPVEYLDAGGNSDAEPLFVDRAAGDLRPAAGSPTIDAGRVDDVSGERDVIGLPRVVGAAADVGAYEYAPPPRLKFAKPPTSTPDTVTASAEIAPGVWPIVRWHLELRRDGELVDRTPAQRALLVSELRHTFTGLTPGSAYMVRAVATGAFGTVDASREVVTRPADEPGASPQLGSLPSAPASPGGAPPPSGDAGSAAQRPAAPGVPATAAPAAGGTRAALRIGLAWRGRALRVTLSERARVTVQLRTRGGRVLRTRRTTLRRGATTVRAPRVTSRVCSVRVIAVDAAGNRSARTLARRCR